MLCPWFRTRLMGGRFEGERSERAVEDELVA